VRLLFGPFLHYSILTHPCSLVNTVADNCNNTIVVVNTVGPRLLDQWIEHTNVTGVLYAGPLGMESGNAIDDVLFGAVNPSGRLIHTIAKNESDYDPGTVISEDSEIDFSEGNFIDWKVSLARFLSCHTQDFWSSSIQLLLLLKFANMARCKTRLPHSAVIGW